MPHTAIPKTATPVLTPAALPAAERATAEQVTADRAEAFLTPSCPPDAAAILTAHSRRPPPHPAPDLPHDGQGAAQLYLVQPAIHAAGHNALPRLRPVTLTRDSLPEGVQWRRTTLPDVRGTSWQRPVHRVATRLDRLLTCLWGETPSGAVPGEVLVERDLRPGHDDITPYPAFRARGRTHHVFVAGSPPQADAQDISEIVLLSGVCPFSAAAAHLAFTDRPPVPVAHARHARIARIAGLLIDERLTVQEEETPLRLAAVSSALAAGIHPHVPVRQQVEVPQAATMLALLQHAYTGELSARQLGQWCDSWVPDRHARLARLMQRRLAQALPAGSRRVQVEIRTQMPAVASYLRAELLAGRLPSMPSLLDRVAADHPLWPALIDAAQPSSPSDLANLSHAAAALQAAQHQPGERAPLVVMVDNPGEHKILRWASTYARALTGGQDDRRAGTRFGGLLGIYPLPRIWAADRTGRVHHNLYAHDPGRIAIDAAGQTIDLARLAAALYRQDATA